MRVRIAIYLLALLFVALPTQPWASTPPTHGTALRIEPEAPAVPVLRTTLAFVLITGLGVEIALRRRAR